jgi:uncharacterized membrane protein YoaK (UPF0700 family)
MSPSQNHPDPPASVPFLQGLLHDPIHDRLPAVLVIMTAVTGVVDAVSILTLGHVFVANMTGNVVFFGFAIAGSPGFSPAASAVALGAFFAGALIAGRLARVHVPSRRDLVCAVVLGELMLVAVAAIFAIGGYSVDGSRRWVITALLALAMGGQNALARRLAVPDLTSTVLTLTFTGLAADGTSQHPSTVARRVVALAAMLLGAVGGALLVRHAGSAWALATATALLLTAGSLILSMPVRDNGR